ncbi:hypothetical protein B2J93_7535 [Marssonina coronariae]|uniref:Short-chain dehydrogenase/reductase n=1 Tax=Diplocarpon coronariae TaxID=2795749 RepID=A0A218Z640_9HELO|nr:hypothetical protein B2J93_7535 [Marssonina coronariae]
MVALNLVAASNARLRELEPGCVALFVGGTSGIGEFTLEAFAQHTVSPRRYLVGRSETAADRVIKECEGLNKNGKVEFVRADVSELAEVDRAGKEIQAREENINLIFQTPGHMNIRGEGPEGLDRRQTLSFWGRMRVISNLLPQLRSASTTSPNFARSASLLGTGTALGTLDTKEIELKSSAVCRSRHTIIMNDYMAEQSAAREPAITPIHTEPGLVLTGVARELPVWAWAALKLITPLISIIAVGPKESGERQLFHATTGMFAPASPAFNAPFASGVPLSTGQAVVTGINGGMGSGAYLVSWRGERVQKAKVAGLEESEVSKIIWEKPAEVFKRVEKINERRAVQGTS